jgi:hypothetical protein
MSAIGTERTYRSDDPMSVIEGKADMIMTSHNVRYVPIIVVSQASLDNLVGAQQER